MVSCSLTLMAQNLYTTQGDAYQISNNEYVITDNANFLQGAIWHNQPINLSQDFWLVFELDFGCNLTGGGDGLALVIQDAGTSLLPQGTGGNLGYNGITPSLVIEFDTFEGTSLGDPAYDHVAMSQNGDIDHNSVNNLAGPFPFDFTLPDVENCNYLKLAVDYNALSNNLTVFYCGTFNGFSIFSQNIDIPNTIFSGNNIVTFGFTGATEFSTNLQKFKHIASNYDSFTKDTTVCTGTPLTIGPIPSNFSCIWEETGGSVISNQNSLTIAPTQQTAYTLTMTDNCSGIQKVETFVISMSNATITEVTSSHIDVGCFGQNTGVLEVSLTGNNPLFSINSGPPQSSGNFNNLNAGSYNVTGVNDQGCSDNIMITINEPSILGVQIDNVGDVLCNTSLTGFIEITPTGGTPNYQVQWTDENNNIINSEDLYNIDDGEFDLLITDNNGCTFNDLIEVEQLNTISSSFLINNPSCYQLSDGSINPIVSGGSAPYLYDWFSQGSLISNNQNVSSLSAGIYNLTVTDNNNCYRNFDVVLDEPNEFTASATIYDASCHQEIDGSITSSFLGGTSPYTSFLMDDTQQLLSSIDSTFNLSAAQYYLYGQDDNGCFSDTLLLNINEPSPILISTTNLIDLECNNIPDGAISVDAIGGTGALTYQWTGPNNFNESGQSINQLFAGNYLLSVIDDNNCIEASTFNIQEPSAININASNISYIKCKGTNTGSIELNCNGGIPPYSYIWSSNNGFTAISNQIDSLYEGNYNVQVFDNNGCSNTSSFNVYEPDSILQYTIETTLSCLNENTGNATINISGGVPPYNINWLGEDPLNIGVGEYNIIVTDEADCIVEKAYVVDTLPLPEASFVIDSVIKVGELFEILNTSEFDVNWYWEFGNNSFSYNKNPTAIYDTEGNYKVELTAFNVYGCSDTTSITILAANDLLLFMPNTFTPNVDYKNESYRVSILNYKSFEISVYNRFSELLFSSNEGTEGWDGNYKGKEVQEGTYVVKVYATDLFGKVYKQKKQIHLIR